MSHGKLCETISPLKMLDLLENVNYGSNELASLGRFHLITTSLLIFCSYYFQRPPSRSLLFVPFWCPIQVLLLGSVQGPR
jgi:hypothetical protein